MKKIIGKKSFLAILSITGCLIILYVIASKFLNYCDNPSHSELVVLFVGPVYQERLQEASTLIKEDYAKNLLIPAYNELLTVVNGALTKNENYQKSVTGGKIYPSYYEDTHIEVLEAKKIMNLLGYSSAIFVSSPYHMRRISIIAERVFPDDGYQLSFVGSRFSGQDINFSIFTWSKAKLVFQEYVKIFYFLAYQFYEINSDHLNN